MVPIGVYDMIRSTEEIELLQCTFQPKTNTQSTISSITMEDKCAQLYEQAIQKMKIRGKSFERRDKTSEQYEFERSQNELTFKPQLCTASRNTNNQMQKSYSTQQLKEMFTSSSSKSIKGYKVATERINKTQTRNNGSNKSLPQHMTVSGNQGTYKNTFSNFPYSVEKKHSGYKRELLKKHND